MHADAGVARGRARLDPGALDHLGPADRGELIERKFRIYGLGDPPALQKFVRGKKLHD